MTVTNEELMEELAELKWQLTQDRHVWKRAENVAKHFDVSLGTVKSWKRRELITGYKHDRTVIYDINAIERDLFQVEN
ncbi:hypothetical protein WZ78_00650 [Leuconostoc mesenteroides subsp. dextranicum]|uniref:hypothetical protein n=1 Tax=Leuconostoc TaxID=1243 RepID=UPI000682E0A1|nr:MULTISPECIES: hypothetical protein [Leuconostoc]KMY78120.1 hypothetical protein WZ79_03785 [Leuconostoc mesenteroides subsp. mesenteroides]KMY82396.1 hypothetical protein WZ78_00650 [Leuconostoc mesenteroides subsp. dextranicum]MCM6834247.1 hypothetical protein [Leuconostoc mesenteroides]MDI6551127.1 hypothetical protein [Leuconostoc suionicum]